MKYKTDQAFLILQVLTVLLEFQIKYLFLTLLNSLLRPKDKNKNQGLMVILINQIRAKFSSMMMKTNHKASRITQKKLLKIRRFKKMRKNMKIKLIHLVKRLMK